jgi:hypothetical protein
MNIYFRSDEMTEQHEMILEKTHPSGEEEWKCPTCGRRMIISWQPWKKDITEQGDLYAAHSGGKGGLRMGTMQVLPVDDSSRRDELESEDTRLAPWAAWLDQSDFENLWKSDDQ